jgi:hypothetical protein
MVEQKSTLVGTFHETKATLPPSFDPLQCLSMLKAGIPLQKVLPSSSPDEGFELIPPSKLVEEKESKKSVGGWEAAVPLLKNMARIMFKPDHPYRTRVGGGSNIATNGSGLLNFVWAVNGIASTSEWSTIDQLFDEFFIHSMAFQFMPVNHLGAGIGSATAATGGGQPPLNSSTSVLVQNAGIQLVSLFSNAASYSSANAMVPNPTLQVKHSGLPWKYVWRNNVRFDPRGISLSGATTESWQGWTLVSGASNHGGSVQARAMSDVVFGDSGHVITLGYFTVVWDVSFRARS